MTALANRFRAALLVACGRDRVIKLGRGTGPQYIPVAVAAAAMARGFAKVDAILGPANTLTTSEWDAVLAAARGEDR